MSEYAYRCEFFYISTMRMHVLLHVYMYVCMYECIYVRMYVCM